MTEDREQLNERYLEAQLRETLGPETDLSDRVLHAVYSKPQRRVIPGPRKTAPWRPLAAAAAVLLAAGVATYALVKILPNELRQRSEQADQPENPRPQPVETPQPKLPKPVDTKDLLPKPPEPPAEPDELPESDFGPKEGPKPDLTKPDDVVGTDRDPSDAEGPPREGWTDPPDSWPDPKGTKYADPKADLPVLISAWKGDGLKVWRAGSEQSERIETGAEFQVRAGDRVRPKSSAEFVLADGSLIRVEGELTFGGEPDALKLTLNDGAIYADVAGPLSVSTNEVSLSVDGVAVIEERLHGVDVFCVSGSVTAGESRLSAGFQSRLEKDGFGREKAIAWADVQREFRFLKDTPTRAMVVEELNEAPGEIFGGKLVDGILTGEVDSDVGIGFYLRQPYTIRDGDVVRFRFRVEKACEMILQFGSVGEGNWRHKMGGVKAGEWIEYELPLIELYKTTDVARKAAPGLALKFFQLHPEDAKAHIEIDRVEIVHRP